MASLCLVLATLCVTPDRSQFFRYDRVSLSCEANWTVQRSSGPPATFCRPPGPGGRPPGPGGRPPATFCRSGRAAGRSVCTIDGAYPSDSGVFWCESPQGNCSRPVNLTVTAGVVILEAPAHGVTEGANVTLRCSYKVEGGEPTSDFQARFFRNDSFIGERSNGTMTLRGVSRSSEGFYWCRGPDHGESPHSWLSVRERPLLAVVPPDVGEEGMLVICGVLLFILYKMLLILCISTYCRWARARKDAKR